MNVYGRRSASLTIHIDYASRSKTNDDTSSGRQARPEQVFPCNGWRHYARNGAAAQQCGGAQRACRGDFRIKID
jgi:hypothetical protein